VGECPLHEDIIKIKVGCFDGKLAFWVFCIVLGFIKSCGCSQQVENELDMISELLVVFSTNLSMKAWRALIVLKGVPPLMKSGTKKIGSGTTLVARMHSSESNMGNTWVLSLTCITTDRLGQAHSFKSSKAVVWSWTIWGMPPCYSASLQNAKMFPL